MTKKKNKNQLTKKTKKKKNKPADKINTKEKYKNKIRFLIISISVYNQFYRFQRHQRNSQIFRCDPSRPLRRRPRIKNRRLTRLVARAVWNHVLGAVSNWS